MRLRFPLSIVLSAAVCLCSLASVSAQQPPKGSGESRVILRIQQGSGSVKYEAPAALIAAMSRESTGVTLPLGTYRGKPVRLSADRLLRQIRDTTLSEGNETHLLSRPTDTGMVFIFAKAAKVSSARGEDPTFLVIDLAPVDKAREPIHFKMPLMGASLIAPRILAALNVVPDTDVSPLVEAFLDGASALGAGPLLTVTSSDAVIKVWTE
jgi:hypothetical protein